MRGTMAYPGARAGTAPYKHPREAWMAEENTIEQNNRDRDEDEADAGGADSAQDKVEQREEGEPAAGGTDDDQSEESQKAQAKEEEREQAREKMEEIEENPPHALEGRPDAAPQPES